MITIIVLLILAGVAIATLTGDNGILTQSQKAKYVNIYKGAEEQVNLATMAVKAEITGQKAKSGTYSATDTESINALKAIVASDLVSEGSGFEVADPENGEITGTKLIKIRYSNTALKAGGISDGVPAQNGHVNYVITVTAGDATLETDIADGTFGTFTAGTGNSGNGGQNEEPETQTGTPVGNTSYVGYYIQKGGEYAIIYVDLVGQTTYTGGALQGSEESVTVPSSATTGKTFKSYVITDTKYTDPNGHFGTNYVIETIGDTTGKDDRFIAMALKDADYDSHLWWHWFYNNASSLGTSYEIGAGKANTETVKAAWDANTSGQNKAQNKTDVWSLVTLDANNKATWFVPSDNEWRAFGAMSWTDNAETPTARNITGGTSGSGGNYSNEFGFNRIYYWSSSQSSSSNRESQNTRFDYRKMEGKYTGANGKVYYDAMVRLSTTF